MLVMDSNSKRRPPPAPLQRGFDGCVPPEDCRKHALRHRIHLYLARLRTCGQAIAGCQPKQSTPHGPVRATTPCVPTEALGGPTAWPYGHKCTCRKRCLIRPPGRLGRCVARHANPLAATRQDESWRGPPPRGRAGHWVDPTYMDVHVPTLGPAEFFPRRLPLARLGPNTGLRHLRHLGAAARRAPLEHSGRLAAAREGMARGGRWCAHV